MDFDEKTPFKAFSTTYFATPLKILNYLCYKQTNNIFEFWHLQKFCAKILS